MKHNYCMIKTTSISSHHYTTSHFPHQNAYTDITQVDTGTSEKLNVFFNDRSTVLHITTEF